MFLEGVRTVRFPLKTRRLLTFGAAIAVSLCALAAGPVRADDIIIGHVLVRVTPGTNVGSLAAANGSAILDHASGSDLYSLRVPVTTTEAAFAAKLAADPRVIYAEPDRYVVSPEVIGEPFHFAFDLRQQPTTYANSSTYVQVGYTGIAPPATTQAFAAVAAPGPPVIVAVLDTGATFTHPDLRTHYIAGYNAVRPDLAPEEAADGIVNYEVGHGTMVAGIIARLAPQARIMPIRVLNGDGAGRMLDLVKGVRYATSHGARIISMSFGASVKSSALNDALDEAELAGIVLVASAGNDNSSNAIAPTVSRGTISVAALDAANKKSAFSNFGSFVRISAPGDNIQSTYSNGGYASWSGTSFAAPFVSAEAALILAQKPGFTADEVKNAILNSAKSVDSMNPSYKGKLGKGIVNIDAALRAAGR